MTQAAGSISPLEQQLLTRVSADRLMNDTRMIARGVRLSGSEAERQAFDYAEAECRAVGATIQRFAPECYISLPGPASLTVLAPNSRTIECITHSFGAPTAGLDGEVVYVGAGGAADFAAVDARGKIALTDGLASPGKMVAATAAGASAVININDENFHEMIVTPVWGAPIPETVGMIPSIPTISVKRDDGEALKALCGQGLRARLTAQVDTGWRPIPCMTAELPGADPDGPFVMFSGHIDSWHYGAMDNGSANATMLETFRVLATRPGGLKRGLRLAFWSGHSHGRYAASTWYVDAFWRELHERCVVHVNVDGTGSVGANYLGGASTMAETRSFAANAIRDITGEELVYKRMARFGDQSCWGPGLPSIFVGLSSQGEPGKPAGATWWWHTIHDTMDKIDPANLARDTKVYVLVCDRLCNDAVIGFDYAAAAREIHGAAQGYAQRAGSGVDLGPSVAAAARLVAATDDLATAVARRPTGADADRLNATLLRLSRLLVPLNYSEVTPYEHDLALPLPAVPLLRGADQLASLEPASDDYKFLRTKLLRAQNRVTHTLDQATATIRQALAE